MITAIVPFVLASVVALDVARDRPRFRHATESRGQRDRVRNGHDGTSANTRTGCTGRPGRPDVREPTRGQALVSSSRRPPGGHPRRVNTAHRHSFRRTPDAHEEKGIPMDAITFTCQYCGEQQKWETRESANVAASWHLYDAHPLRWLTVAGHRPPTDPRPRRARRWADPPRSHPRSAPRPVLLGAGTGA
jgi:hypothetical protein